MKPSPSSNRAETILIAALDRATEDREAFLETVCGEDASLLAEVRALLASHESAPTGFLVPPGTASSDDDEATLAAGPGAGAHRAAFEGRERPDDLIGPYKLREQIGEGGFGTVWVAEQDKPVRRRVALKIVKLGMDTREVIARFEQERQALAMMDHPNIAKVFDAGSTDTGRPYFVMELVRGVQITDYCDEKELPTRQRLELFITVCQAVQHAHQKGIIHRDLKPSNILVTMHDGKPLVKVIDFGVAKATQGRLSEQTIYTQFQQMIGTPLYMSPEQADMTSQDVDTRSDVYSLGVLLYELLTGGTPIDAATMRKAGLDEMRRIIREVDPPRPSLRLRTLDGNRLTSTAKRRHTEPAKLPGALRGDLDWIVMKCLEKDRTRRYDTANGLAMDLQRHLANEVITARPPTSGYLLGKLIRRNKAAFAATGAIALALLIGIVASSLQAMRATKAEELAKDRLAESEEAKASEAMLRLQAEEDELIARQRAYASDMNVAQQALDGSNLGRAIELLNRQRPLPGQRDLRGWEWRYLWEQTRSDALFELCQENEIESLSVSSDGALVAIGLVHQGGLLVYDLRTRQEVVHLAQEKTRIRAAFSPVGSLLAFTGAKVPASKEEWSTLHLWDTATQQMVAAVPVDGLPTGVAFSENGRSLAMSSAYSEDCGISVWQIPKAVKLKSYPIENHPDIAPSTGFAVTPDLRLAATWTADGRIRVIDLQNGQELWNTGEISEALITALAFSPDGKTLASAAGYRESDIRLWDVASGTEFGRLKGHRNWVGSLVFWPDGSKLASSSADQTIRTWDVANRECLGELKGHRQEVWRLALLPDNRTLVSACKDGTVCVWDTSSAHPRSPGTKLSDKTLTWQFTPNSRSVITLEKDGRVSLRSGANFEKEETLLEVGDLMELPSIPGEVLSRSLISPDCTFLALGSSDGKVTIWDLARRSPRCEFEVGDGVTKSKGITTPLAFSAGGTRLVCHSWTDNTLFEWDLESDQKIQDWKSAPAFFGFGVSPDERLGIAIGWHGHVNARNLPSGKNADLPPDFDAPEGTAVAFSPSGQHLAIASALGFARVWDAATWKPEATLSGFLNAVGSVSFSPNGRRLATGSANANDAVKLWDASSWQEVFTLKAEDEKASLFTTLAFSPDGNAVGTSSRDGCLHLWRAPSWEDIDKAEAREADSHDGLPSGINPEARSQ